MRRITDKDFVYVNAAATDIRKTFAKARRRIQREQEQAKVNASEVATKVKQIARAK